MRNLSLDMDTTLGGNQSSNEKSPSQKAVKTYVDENIKDQIDEMEDVSISEVSDGQILSYDSEQDKWINKDNISVLLRKWS